MKFTLAIFALLAASVSTLKLDATAEAGVEALTSIDMMMLANAEADAELEIEKMTPAQQHRVDVTAKRSLEEMDSNHDGKVSFDEAKAFFMKSLNR